MKKSYYMYSSWYFLMYFALGGFFPLFSQLLTSFKLEGSILGIFGITTGIILSFLIMSLLKMGVFNKLTEIYYLTSIPVEISFKEICLIVGATAVVIFISSVFPSYRAAKLTPVEALKYE